ncbi:MAG: cytochrome c biogenesis protein [Candidatus Kapaibacteriales bacterium]
MKGLIVGLSVLIGVGYGISTTLKSKKSLHFVILTFLFMTLTILLTFVPYIGSNFKTFKYISENKADYSGPLYFKLKPDAIIYDSLTKAFIIEIYHPKYPQKRDDLVIFENLPPEFSHENSIIAKVRWDRMKNYFVYESTISVNPLLVLPLVPQLEDQIKIMNFHVPCAWVAVLAYLIAMFYSIKYLKTKNLENDLVANSSVYLGTVFAILATVTGMIWAKFNWGSFWNWDPRQTTVFVLLLIYFAYFALRQSIENPELRSRLSAVYSIIAFTTVPFLVFILPRILVGNHPGSANSENAGPILSTEKETLNLLQTFGFASGFLSMTLLFFWFLNLLIRFKIVRNFSRIVNV